MADVVQQIDQLVAKAQKAAEIMKGFTQEQVDKILCGNGRSQCCQ